MTAYVPLVFRLEVREKKISFDDTSRSLFPVTSNPAVPLQRQRLMKGGKKRSTPPSNFPAVAPPAPPRPDSMAPTGSRARTTSGQHPQPNYRGKRTYSEVVVETYEAAARVGEDAASSLQSTSRATSKAASEPPDVDKKAYFYGNPFVEKTEGIMHFYKYNDEKLVKDAQCRMLCMLGVPAQITVQELVSFAGIAINTIERIKIVRDNTPNQYMAIIKFKTHNDAIFFYDEFNNEPFNDLEPHRCVLLFVDRIECVTEDEMEQADTSASDCGALTELPNCAVCLERMDDGVLSILCNHAFHAHCLQKWSDTTCPVCRYTQTPELVADQRCSVCDQSTDLWICLICGSIGCGRYANSHAFRHFELTSHTFCLQVGGDRVWDYAGDNYVHRLIQSDSDGKLVEYQMGGTSDENREDKSDKLEGIKLEYTCLLTNQLENQRKFFEARIADIEKAMDNMEKVSGGRIDELEGEVTRLSKDLATTSKSLSDKDQAHTTLEKKFTQLNTKYLKTQEELKSEREMSAIFLSDQKRWKERLDSLEKRHTEKEAELSKKVNNLEEQVNDYLMHFEAQTKIATEIAQNSVTQQEVDESTFGTTSTPQRKPRRKSNKK